VYPVFWFRISYPTLFGYGMIRVSCGSVVGAASACILIGPVRAVMRPYRSWPRWIME
jgi:hypothetical protein